MGGQSRGARLRLRFSLRYFCIGFLASKADQALHFFPIPFLRISLEWGEEERRDRWDRLRTQMRLKGPHTRASRSPSVHDAEDDRHDSDERQRSPR